MPLSLLSTEIKYPGRGREMYRADGSGERPCCLALNVCKDAAIWRLREE